LEGCIGAADADEEDAVPAPIWLAHPASRSVAAKGRSRQRILKDSYMFV
jgi:hypothetical protein